LHSESLETEIQALKTELTQREQAMSEDEQLLAHDLELYAILEWRAGIVHCRVYDVAGTGHNHRPYGRVFIQRVSHYLYAYDLTSNLDSRMRAHFKYGVKRSPDREHAFNLGIFYEDSAAKKDGGC